jgi:hypothetical protein
MVMEEGSVAAGRVCAALFIPKDKSSAKKQTIPPKFIRTHRHARGQPKLSP